MSLVPRSNAQTALRMAAVTSDIEQHCPTDEARRITRDRAAHHIQWLCNPDTNMHNHDTILNRDGNGYVYEHSEPGTHCTRRGGASTFLVALVHMGLRNANVPYPVGVHPSTEWSGEDNAAAWHALFAAAERPEDWDGIVHAIAQLQQTHAAGWDSLWSTIVS